MTTFEMNLLRLSFLVATVSTVGSLFFSEVMKLPPCSLCWYQRIFMYPLVYIFGVGLFKESADYFKYATGLVGIGWVIAVYHNLLYFGIIPETLSPCTMGVPCSARLIEWFGWISIPQLSLFAFTILGLTLFFVSQKRGVSK